MTDIHPLQFAVTPGEIGLLITALDNYELDGMKEPELWERGFTKEDLNNLHARLFAALEDSRAVQELPLQRLRHEHDQGLHTYARYAFCDRCATL